jgi:hypothetical protein
VTFAQHLGGPSRRRQATPRQNRNLLATDTFDAAGMDWFSRIAHEQAAHDALHNVNPVFDVCGV